MLSLIQWNSVNSFLHNPTDRVHLRGSEANSGSASSGSASSGCGKRGLRPNFTSQLLCWVQGGCLFADQESSCMLIVCALALTLQATGISRYDINESMWVILTVWSETTTDATMPKILSFLGFYVVFLHASSIFYATDSLPVIMHDEKAKGKLKALLQHFMKNLLLSFLVCPGVSSYFPFDSFYSFLQVLFVRIRVLVLVNIFLQFSAFISLCHVVISFTGKYKTSKVVSF